MNTTQDPTLSPDEVAEAALVALDEVDPADAPEAAELVADALTTSLENDDATVAEQTEREREGTR